MARREYCELTNMCMVCDGEKILVQNRTKPGWTGLTFPGGHVEAEESVVESVIREVREETGLAVSDLRICGVKQFTTEGRRFLVFCFRADSYSGELRSSEEGGMFWIDRKDLYKYRLASGMETTFELFFREDLNEDYQWLEDGEWKGKNY